MDTMAADDLCVEQLAPAMRSLRIAMVTETWPPEVNGVAMTLARLVEGLRERNHALQLIRPRQTRQDGGTADAGWSHDGWQEVLLRGLPIPRYPHLKMGVPSKQRLLELWTLQRPDLVHIATEGPLGWSALQAAQRLKLPVVSDFRTNFHAYSAHYGIGWLKKPIVGYLRKFHNRTLCTMVPTEALRRQLTAAGFENLQVVARGVDTQQFSPLHRSDALRQQWGAADGERVVTCVGRLAPEKNLGLLLEALAAMRQADPTLKLVLVGDGPARPALQAACPDAIFAGQRRGADLAAHYASADLFLFPSETETFGNVVPEAMASGLAVLAYDLAAAGQLITPGVDGLLAPAGQRSAFVQQAVQLARQRLFTQQLGRQARATAAAMGWDRIVQQVERTYLSALATGPRPQASSRFLPQPRTS
ncbi:MAG: glycosyltransferase family 1 protein [Burkholderiaceae bacterium]|nr:glycosyltransferase family 1 protein [Burkholderiaceae bacterium]